MSQPPSPASSESSAPSEVDSLVGRPSDGPRFKWSDLGLPLPLEEHTALESSQATSTSSRKRGRPSKGSSRRGDNLRKTPKGPGRERPRDAHGNFASKSTTPSIVNLPGPQEPPLAPPVLSTTDGRSSPSRSRGRPTKRSSRQGENLRTTPKSMRGAHLNKSSRVSRSSKSPNSITSTIESTSVSGRVCAAAGESAGLDAAGTVPSPGGWEGPDGFSASSPPVAIIQDSPDGEQANVLLGPRTAAIPPDALPKSANYPDLATCNEPNHRKSRQKERSTRRGENLRTTPQSKRGSHLKKSSLSSGSSTSRDSSGRFSSARKQPSTFGAAITRRAPAALPGERSGRDTTGTVLCPGGAEGPGGVSVSSPPPAGSPPDVDALRDTENCCPSVVPDVEDVLPDPLADPVFAALLAKATELMTRVADSQTVTISTMTMDDMTVIADVPKHLPLVHIQRQLMEVAEQKDLIVTCFNAHCGQGRLEGDYIPFCRFGDGKKGFSHLESGTFESNVLRETEVYLIDNANLIQEDHWRYFLQQVVYCRNRYEHSGLVCFILMGADRLAYGRNDPTLTTDGVLPQATLCRSALSDASSLTQLARLEFNWRVDLQKNGLDKSINFFGHYDNVSTYISTGAHSLNALAGEFKTTAITEFPGRGEVMLLTCYDTPSSLMPDAVDIHEFIAFKGQRMSPDYTPPDLYPQITKANLRYYIHF